MDIPSASRPVVVFALIVTPNLKFKTLSKDDLEPIVAEYLFEENQAKKGPATLGDAEILLERADVNFQAKRMSQQELVEYLLDVAAAEGIEPSEILPPPPSTAEPKVWGYFFSEMFSPLGAIFALAGCVTAYWIGRG